MAGWRTASQPPCRCETLRLLSAARPACVRACVPDSGLACRPADTRWCRHSAAAHSVLTVGRERRSQPAPSHAHHPGAPPAAAVPASHQHITSTPPRSTVGGGLVVSAAPCRLAAAHPLGNGGRGRLRASHIPRPSGNPAVDGARNRQCGRRCTCNATAAARHRPRCRRHHLWRCGSWAVRGRASADPDGACRRITGHTNADDAVAGWQPLRCSAARVPCGIRCGLAQREPLWLAGCPTTAVDQPPVHRVAAAGRCIAAHSLQDHVHGIDSITDGQSASIPRLLTGTYPAAISRRIAGTSWSCGRRLWHGGSRCGCSGATRARHAATRQPRTRRWCWHWRRRCQWRRLRLADDRAAGAYDRQGL